MRAHLDGLRPVYDIMRRINAGADVRSVLDAVAAGVATATGFEVAAISWLTADHEFEIVTVAGDDGAREALVGRRVPLEEMEAELALADRWGSLLFIPAERLDGAAGGWIPDLEVDGDPEAWHPEDTLRAPLRSPEGELLGLLAVDLPVDGKRPDGARRELLEMYAELAGLAIANARRTDELAERVRLATAVEALHTQAARTLDVGAIVETSAAAVAEALTADVVWVRAFDGDDELTGAGRGARHPDRDGADAPPEVLAIVARSAREAWAAGRVDTAVLQGDEATFAATPLGTSLHGSWADADRHVQVPVAGGAAGWVRDHTSPSPYHDASDQARIVDFLRPTGARSLLLVPMGAGPDCLGYVVALRGRGRPPFAPHEVATAAQVAGGLGQAVLNARMIERERALVAQLSSLDHYKHDLISTVSHELRTPLTSIKGHLELIEDDPTGSAEASFAVVRRNLDRVGSLIDDLLTLKKVSNPDRPLETRAVDLQQVLLDAASALALRAQEEGVSLQVAPAAGPVIISGDHEELERVALNLVGNAVKYTPAGGRVELWTERSDRFVRMVCRDDGIGISKRDQEELFTEFFRSTNPDALAAPGTGLGLSIVRRIVQRHGGSIRLESDLGEGSTFTVRLPLSHV
ncbi:ATP-binding protein [Nocardioides perillae]|uniref:Sensor-like histidine kinase SenX3 n=1 Tax=Nocardioides perillae TaxID=1119534 RepID=A0A7Y9RR94_9ACTN|nr:signal transduction histidine kinase [Nocardioides perillae]